MKSIDRFNECLTFSDVLRFQAQQSPNHAWYYDGSTGESHTFKEIDEWTDRAVSYLIQKGCRPGDIISVVLSNCFEYIILFFATLRMGCIFNPFPSNLSAQDVLKYLAYIQPKLVFCHTKHFSDLKAGKSAVELVIDKKNGGGFLENLKAFKFSEIRDFSPIGHEAACIYYSSGTTDNPKGVIYSHRNMLANISSIVTGFGWKTDDCHLVVLPLGHTAAINYSFLPCMYCGARLILFESFWKVRIEIWKQIEKFSVTYMEVVPSVLFSLLNTPYKDYKREKIKQFKYIGCGSAPLPLEIQKKTEERFKVKVANLYGLSETGPTHFDNPLESGWQPGSIGRPLDCNEAKILDPDGKEVPVGEIGEIAIKGPNVFEGYFKNERTYKQAFKNGFFMTGDLGYIDSKGIFYFTERKKDLIIKGGVNIFPGEIDEVIFSHPSVKESLTVGVPDSYLGERVKSFIVLKEKEKIEQKDIKEFCFQKLGDFKCPDDFVFVDDIPKGPSGKLLRRALRESGSVAQSSLFEKELSLAKSAAQEAGKIQLELFSNKNHVIRKSSKELVSRVDIESQKIIEGLLKKGFPQFKIFTEEKIAGGDYPSGELFWIVDPLDGTHNYIAGLPFYGISIALADLNCFYVGVIYLPFFDALFWAVRGQGAYCNGAKIEVSKNNEFSKSMVTYDNQFYLSPKSLKIYERLIENSFTTRITGSAVYDLCLIANGKIDARIWNNTKICDIAAGLVLVTEAGGRMTDFKSRAVNLSCGEVVASNSKVHDKVISILNEE